MSGPPPPPSAGPGDGEFSPSERRLVELLRPLRENPPPASPGTALAVVRRARWQRPLRAAVQTAGHLVAAVGDAIGMALGLRGRGKADR